MLLTTSTSAGFVISVLQELYKRQYGYSIKEFDPRLSTVSDGFDDTIITSSVSSEKS